jgi:hypothetical protein
VLLEEEFHFTQTDMAISFCLLLLLQLLLLLSMLLLLLHSKKGFWPMDFLSNEHRRVASLTDENSLSLLPFSTISFFLLLFLSFTLKATEEEEVFFLLLLRLFFFYILLTPLLTPPDTREVKEIK